ncbi:MAG: 2-C-methyl-D-erythritol 2,4-cyclodiphosphate synthase [Victivallales bacterium]|nr:2-C-methyl-D-erythritol 2,4-cyclodiphosphate synthase [Victivallales bacterium]
MSFRIGQGFDLHRIVEGRPLVIGGVSIPSQFGLLGHSDADVLLHAIIDAILGAIAAGDIGTWFPDTNPVYKDADSADLLQTVLASDVFQGWHIVNLDCTIFAEQPRFAPWREQIRASLAKILNCPIENISVKAKTNEKLDAVGEGLAISAAAIVLLENQA